MTGQHPSLPFPAPNAMPPDTIHTGANVCSLGYEARFLPTTYSRLPELYGAGYPDHIAYLNGLTPSHPVLYSGALVSNILRIVLIDVKIKNGTLIDYFYNRLLKSFAFCLFSQIPVLFMHLLFHSIFLRYFVIMRFKNILWNYFSISLNTHW